MPDPQPPEAPRREHWIATYVVEVAFDTDLAGRRYDHVGTQARCRHCHTEILLRGSDDALARHARQHEAELSIEQPGAKGGDRR